MSSVLSSLCNEDKLLIEIAHNIDSPEGINIQNYVDIDWESFFDRAQIRRCF